MELRARSLRLKQLEETGVVMRKQGQQGAEYHLTQAGKEFAPIIQNLGEMGASLVPH
jgi:DNA-binding HxlR family transcriptional regulator